jgi:hypothetical protein
MIETEMLRSRLESLRSDYAGGERALHELDGRREQLVADLLRVSGAIQVLEELLSTETAAPTDAPHAVP